MNELLHCWKRLNSLTMTGLLLALLYTSSIEAPAQVYPVTVSVNITGVPSAFLSDYTNPDARGIKCSLLFNDFNEPSWNVFLSFSLRNSGISIESPHNFKPAGPIILTPGMPYILNATDLAPYFNFERLVVSGMQKSDLQRTGRLPEGFWQFSIKAYDYQSGKQLSNEGTLLLNIQFSEPPALLQPLPGCVLLSNPSLATTFEWSDRDIAAGDREYSFCLYQLQPPFENAASQVLENKAIKIYESGSLQSRQFKYSPGLPPLQKGMAYAWRVQARNANGKNSFKNDGWSQVSMFYYGYPQKGRIELIEPADDHTFLYREDKYFKWEKPDNLTPGQTCHFILNIYERHAGQSAEEATHNPPWYTYTSPGFSAQAFYDWLVDKKMSPNQEYFWQIKAFTGEDLIAESQKIRFTGPPLLEYFRAGNQRLKVLKLDNSDPQNLSGKALAVIAGDGSTQEVQFKNLKLANVGGEYKLREGEIRSAIRKTTLQLTPENSLNGPATLVYDSLLISQDRFDLKCIIKWPLPHATLPGTINEVSSKPAWLSYEDFKLTGELPVAVDSLYKLIDPFGFNIKFSQGSYFIIRGINKYLINLNGIINCKSGEAKPGMQFLFYGTDQLNMFRINASDRSLLNLVDDKRIVLKAVNGIIDLSEISSIPGLGLVPSWKGIVIDEYEIVLKNNDGTRGQFIQSEEIHFAIHPDSSLRHPFLITSAGVLLKFGINLIHPIKVSFNSFPALLKCFQIQLTAGEISSARIEGTIVIPVISKSQEFPFVIPVSSKGLHDGYLNNDLGNFKWIFNSGKVDEEIQIIIGRAIFESNDKLKLDIKFNWPAIEISQLHLNSLCIWGNGKIGFTVPNGVIEPESAVVGKVDSYPFELTKIGAGYSNGCYAFGASGNIDAGEGVTGVNGPPVLNVYSIQSTAGDSIGVKDPDQIIDDFTNKEVQDIVYKIQDSDTASSRRIANVELARAKENYDTIIDILDRKQYEICNQAIANLNSSYLKDTTTENTGYFKASFETSLSPTSIKNVVNNVRPEDIIAIIDALSPDLTESDATQLHKIKEFINSLSARQLRIIYLQLTDIQKLLRAKLDNLISSATDKIKSSIDTINAFFRREIYGVSNDVSSELSRQLSSFFNQLRIEIRQNLNILSPDDLDLLDACIRSVSDELSKQFTSSFNNAIDKNLVAYFTDSITNKIYKRIEYAMHSELCKSALESIMEGRLDISIKPLLANIENDVKKQIDFENIKKVIRKTGSQIFAGINLKGCSDKVLKDFSEALLQKLSILKDKVNGKLDEIKEKYLPQIDGTPVLGETNIGAGVSLNFNNLGQKLKNKDVMGLVKLDPIYISGSFKFLKYSGKLDFCNNDPVFGKVWKGDIEMAMTSPLPFSIEATYITGRINDFNYWMIQIEPKEENSKQNSKTTKRPKILKNPVNLGFIKLMAVSGRVFHHMTDVSGKLIPDQKSEYGAFLGFIVFDGAANGKLLRAELDADFQINENEDYNLALKGNLQTGSKIYSVLIPDPKPTVNAVIELSYNSAAKHFIGKGVAEINKPSVLCAKGMIYIDISPGKWNLMIGSREERVIFVPACAGWSPTGWLAINQSQAELGLGVQFSFSAYEAIDLKFAELGILIDAGIAAGIEAKVSYNPFAIDELGIWADIWALIAIKYALHIPWEKSGTINLVDIACKGDLVIRFHPVPTTLIGDVRGHVRILGIVGCNFKGHFEKHIS